MYRRMQASAANALRKTLDTLLCGSAAVAARSGKSESPVLPSPDNHTSQAKYALFAADPVRALQNASAAFLHVPTPATGPATPEHKASIQQRQRSSTGLNADRCQERGCIRDCCHRPV